VKVSRLSATEFVAQFETEEELHDEHRTNLTHGALQLLTSESVAPHSPLTVTLRGPGGGQTEVKATVVAALPAGIALAIDGDPEERLRRLLYAETSPPSSHPAAEAAAAPQDAARAEGRPGESAWDRMRGLSQMEKILLAVKADRTERALLLQDTDPRVLLSLLRNPRLTVDEVVRVTKSPHLTFQVAEVIAKTTQWMASLDVRLGLVNNPKTPVAFALRILPTLPDQEVRAIARGGTSMQLKQAALRKLQGKP
jgi:hypothetical protein